MPWSSRTAEDRPPRPRRVARKAVVGPVLITHSGESGSSQRLARVVAPLRGSGGVLAGESEGHGPVGAGMRGRGTHRWGHHGGPKRGIGRYCSSCPATTDL